MSDYITIELSKKGKHAGKYETIVDAIDSDLAALDWKVVISNTTQYAARDSGKQYLHRIILARKLERDKLLSHEYVDHIDGDGLNNRRDNLRLATPSQNVQNGRRRITNTSGYKGVYRYRNGRWIAQIVFKGQHFYLGQFDTAELAYQAYCEKAKELHGEFANYGNE